MLVWCKVWSKRAFVSNVGLTTDTTNYRHIRDYNISSDSQLLSLLSNISRVKIQFEILTDGTNWDISKTDRF